MAIHKLHLEEFDQVDYNLIAIYASIEDYKLAYQLNQNLTIKLTKNDTGIPLEIMGKKASFSRFTYDDNEKMMIWDLIQNKQEIEHPIFTSTKNLFEDKNLTTQITLVNELKKVDYFLKIEYDLSFKIIEIINIINNMDLINAAFEVNPNQIKSKNNLIF
jgi:hypothetical protein